jgi:ubiquinone/menaquinone biosynthesis C-methylase UbiE
LQYNVFSEKLAIEYDNIVDLFYSWLYSRLHFFITKYVIDVYHPKKVLDIGCGTGFQSFLYAYSGSSVVGVDISERMIKMAMNKSKTFSNVDNISFFPECFDFVTRYNSLINSKIGQNFNHRKNSTPSFVISDICQLPFPDDYFCHISSCGSVLSLVEHSHSALKELTRVLKPGGTLFIEFENKWNMDRFWTLLDVLLRNKIGYWSSFKEALQPFSSIRQNVSINYPYGEHDNPINTRIKLFINSNLKQEFSILDLRIKKRWTIHSVTNFIPSPILDTNKPSRVLRDLFKILSTLEERIPLSLPGCTAVYFLQKRFIQT